MIINFFRNRQEERMDFGTLIDDYFDKLPNSSITSDDQEVKIEMSLKEFDFKYAFLITKRSRVSSIYRLNPNYMNINLLIDVPAALPDYLYRVMLSHVGEICEKFNLKVYYDRAEDIQDFDMFKLLTILKQEEDDFFRKNPDRIKYTVPAQMLSEMCQYQALTKDIEKSLKSYAKPSIYQPLYDTKLKVVRNSMVWTLGTPAIFPPHLQYVMIEDTDGAFCVIPYEYFEKFAGRFFSYVKDAPMPIHYFNEKYAARAAKKVIKMRKYVVPFSNFQLLKITDLVEGE